MRLSLFSTVNENPRRFARFCANFRTWGPLWGEGRKCAEFGLYTYHIHLRGTFQHDKHY